MLPTQTEVEQFTIDIIADMAQYCRDMFNLDSDWVPVLKMSFSPSRLCSRAGAKDGKPIMKLAMRRFLFPVDGMLEYDAYKHDAYIGAFQSEDWKVCVRGLVAHEIAHCVQFTLAGVCGARNRNELANSYVDGLGRVELGHGIFFRRIYKQIRRGFVNHLIAPEKRGVSPLGPTVAPDAKRKSKPATTDHPFVGREIMHSRLGKCQVIEHKPSGRKFKFTILQLSTNIRFKTTTERLAVFGCK
jgi:hypothetical protein